MWKDKSKRFEYQRRYYWEHRDQRLAYDRARGKGKRRRIKLEVFSHYCNGKPRCMHCGEIDLRVLCIDHINGGGTQERKRTKQSGGHGFYYRLKTLGYPDGYQVLCANCNLRKQIVDKEQ